MTDPISWALLAIIFGASLIVSVALNIVYAVRLRRLEQREKLLQDMRS
jgi:hypothetical protein